MFFSIAPRFLIRSASGCPIAAGEQQRQFASVRRAARIADTGMPSETMVVRNRQAAGWSAALVEQLHGLSCEAR